MANEDMNLVSSSQYDIYSKLLTIAKKYTDIDEEDFLKTGLFGYITESMALVARDSSFHKTMLYNESFLNTAVMPKSVYNWAKMFNINITSATPAYTDILVTIAVDDIAPPYTRNFFQTNNQKYGAELNTLDREVLVLDRDTPFIAGNVQFLMERSIVIYRSSSNLNNFIVKYLSTETTTTNFENPESLFLGSSISRTDGVEYLTFQVRAYQYVKNEIQRQISSSSFLDTKIHKFQFSDQFVSANLKYKKGTMPEEEIQLRFSDISSESRLDQNIKFAYYNLISENEIQITFSSSSNDFIPAANSTLILDAFSTKGSSGNIEYSQQLIFRLRDEALRNLPVFATMADQRSIGGIDIPSINKIKNAIINEISTRDVIVTEEDLNRYFLILTALLETINDGKVTFIKKRDDILRRVFGSFILMRDGLTIDNKVAKSGYISKTIPTNTLTADFDLTTSVSKPFGSIIQRKSDINEYEYVDSTENNDYYIIPFYTRVTLNPFRKVKYIYNLTNDSASLNFKEIFSSSSEKYIIPSNVTVDRGFEGTNAANSYEFKFNFVTNFNLSNELLLGSDSFTLSFFRRGAENIAIRSANFDLATNITKVDYESTENENSPGLFESYISFIFDIGTEEFDFSQERENSEFGTNINLLDSSNNLLSLPEDVKVSLKLNGITRDNLNMEFISGNFLSLFRNLDELMYSDVIVNTEIIEGDTTVSSIKIKDIPVVHSSFFNSIDDQNKFIRQLFTYIEMLKQNLGKLETNTFFDLKFYNTYGDSQYYNTLRTDIKLELDIYLREYTDDLKLRIQDYTRLLVDRANDGEELSISNITTNLKLSFPESITRIEFKGLNDTFAQHIGRTAGVREGEYAPEHLNIPNENLQYIRVGTESNGRFIVG